MDLVKFTEEDFKVLLKSLFDEGLCRAEDRSFFNSDFEQSESEYDEDSEIDFKTLLKENSIKVNFLDNHGGEGEGEDFWSVYSFTKDGLTVYIKFDGYYQSYNGSEFDSWFFVIPKEKTITVYE